MSFKNKKSEQNKKSELSSDLSRQYRQIGIKAVSAAARKAPSSESDRENENRTKEEEDDA